MKAKRTASLLLTALFLLPALTALGGCSARNEIILRVYNWEEYIDEGGEGSYVYDMLKDELDPDGEMTDKQFQKWYSNHYEDELAPSVIDDFENWYEETYPDRPSVRVEYSTFGTNEDMYNQVKLGNSYDLLCPSDYMIMKLAAEGMLEPFSDEFFDEEIEENYYIKNVSPFIYNVFENGTMDVIFEKETDKGVEYEKEVKRWSEYAAGYMWGNTGLIYNPEYVSEDQLSQGWSIMLDSEVKGKITTKDNVRDSYFVGLAILYKDELLSLDREAEDYNENVTEIMNRTDEKTVSEVQQILLEMKKNIFGFETDTGKSDMVKGNIWLNFAWSGDAVYALDLAEEDNTYLNYYVPDECANLWFDGWVIPKDASRSAERKHAAEAFVNFMSRPDNAVRNSYYIGYTSVIAGDEMFEYMSDTYSVEEGDEEEAVPYDVSYFFGGEAGDYVIDTYEDQLERQLYAQYPPEETMLRCAVMDYYGDDDALINELWTKVKGETLDAWAIAVICVAVVAIALFIVFVKFGGKIDFFRRKPKKGYVLVEQKPAR